MSSTHTLATTKDSPRICIVAGLPRAGSTFLYHNLGLHPQLFPPFRKETNYFLSNFERGIEWYLSLFKDRTIDHKYCLDVSPSYFIDTSTIQRIQEYNNKPKIIIVVRKLDDLVLSWYDQQLTHFMKFLSFESFMLDWKAQRGDKEVHIRMNEAPFKKAIIAFSDAFAEDLLLIAFDELINNSLHTLQTIEKFLGIDSFYTCNNYDDRAINSRNRKNFRVVSWLLSREFVISKIDLLFPRSLVIRLRSMFDKFSAQEPSQHESIDPRRRIVNTILKEDMDYIEQVFSNGSILLGNGSPFPHVIEKEI